MARCLICHRRLTDPESIRLGIGEECRKKPAFAMRLYRSELWHAGKAIKVGTLILDPAKERDRDYLNRYLSALIFTRETTARLVEARVS